MTNREPLSNQSSSAGCSAALDRLPAVGKRWLAAIGYCTLVALLSSPLPLAAQDLAHFLNWFVGAYDNNEQVWQQAQDDVPPEDRHQHIHHVITPVSAPAIGDHVVLARQYHDRNYGSIQRQRLYSLRVDTGQAAIEMTGYRFLDQQKYRDAWQDESLLRNITVEELRHVPGCGISWQLAGDHYQGKMNSPSGCEYHSESLDQPVQIKDSPRLSADVLVLAERGYDAGGKLLFGSEQPYRNRRVRHFSGWAAIERGSFAPESSEAEEMLLVPDLRLHNEGQIIPLVTAAGDATGYSAELARLTYQNTRVAVLKLAVLDSQTGDTVAYAWANPGAGRIGINLGWLQVGLTAEDGQASTR